MASVENFSLSVEEDEDMSEGRSLRESEWSLQFVHECLMYVESFPPHFHDMDPSPWWVDGDREGTAQTPNRHRETLWLNEDARTAVLASG